MFKSSNPALNASNYSKSYGQSQGASTSMTMDGTVNKTGILLVLVIAAAIYPWYQVSTLGNANVVMPLMLIGFIGGFILALITILIRPLNVSVSCVLCITITFNSLLFFLYHFHYRINLNF